MKLNNIKALILGLLVFPAISCSEYVEGINESPNDATDAPFEALVIAAQVSIMGVFESEDARLASMFTQQFTGSDRQYSGYEVYNGITSETFTFSNTYIGIIQPLLDAQAKAEALGNDVSVGMLKVMKAMTFGYLADMYGDIPFSEANQYPAISDPIYDDQIAVYAGVQSMLDEAITNMGSGNGIINEGTDLFFGGDPDVWIELANTLKGRFYLHTGNYASALTAANNGISSPDNDMLTSHETAVKSASQNSWYDFHKIQREGYLTAKSAYLPTLLDTAAANYRGNAKTDESERFAFIYTGEAGAYDLNIEAEGMFAVDAPFPLATYIENQLIIAECNLRMETPDMDAALAALNNVRDALASQFTSGTYNAYVLADFQTGGMANTGQATAAEALLYEIIEEKYVSLVGQIEVFNDLRRLKNPLGLTPRNNSSQFPQRFLYPTDEVNSNEHIPSPLPGLFDPTDVNM